MTGESEPTWACAIIHHCNLISLSRTVTSFLADGLDSSNLIVIDNSGPLVTDREIVEAIGSKVRLRRIANNGYGNAANFAIDQFTQGGTSPDQILIVTHEVQPRRGSTKMLRSALASSKTLVAVGPALLSSQEVGKGWISTGGALSPFLGIPRHSTVSSLGDLSNLPQAVDRKWLDGACVLYDLKRLGSRRFREEFFLYYEETELHLRLAEFGGVACVPAAVVEEVANDVPARLQGRNLQWLLSLHGRWWQRMFTVPWLISRTAVKVVAGRTHRSELSEMAFGWNEARANPIHSLD